MQIGAPSHLVAAVVNAADNCTEIGVNPATAAKDERAWALWSRMCTHLNTSAVRTAQDVRDFPGRITFLLTSLMLYARMWCVPKQPGQPNIRPKSCLAYPLAIIRIYKRWGIALPGYKQLCACLQGMCRAYVNHHGPGSLTPRKAEPFRFEMARAIYDLPDGTNIGKLRWLYDSQDVFIFRRANLFAMSSGARLAAISGNSVIKRANASWTFSGVVHTDPSPQLLNSIRPGDQVMVSLPPGKCDQWLEVHAHFPYTFVFDNDRYNVAKAICEIELRCPCHGEKRLTTPLFANSQGSVYPHTFFCDKLKTSLNHLYGANTASLFTWHSYRSGLATALHAAGVPDEVIMLMCHWVAPESLRSYRRLSSNEYASWLQKAAQVPVNLLQPHNAPVVSGDQHYAALHAAFSPATAAGQMVATPNQPAPAPAPTPVNQCAPPQLRGACANANQFTPPPAPYTTTPPIGAQVFIPRRVWPTYPCSECDQLGWLATVHSATSRTAVVRFLEATTAAGRPYKNVRLPLHLVFPVSPGPQLVQQVTGGQPRGGCRQPPAKSSPHPMSHPTGAPYKEPPPSNNRLGYPQLVDSDKCALCKRWLEPLEQDREEGRLPTRVDTRERLQCERCQKVRYCDAWCAHIHYEACHKYTCPLPPFDTLFNAEYVVRKGRHVRIMPVHCVRQELLNGGGLNAPAGGLARTHVWSAVPHATAGDQCEFCHQLAPSCGP